MIASSAGFKGNQRSGVAAIAFDHVAESFFKICVGSCARSRYTSLGAFLRHDLSSEKSE